MLPPSKLEKHEVLLALEQGQPARIRETLAVHLSAARVRLAQPPLPEIKTYIAAQIEFPIIEKLIADHDHHSPEIHRQRAGDTYVVARVVELVSLLREEAVFRTAGKKSAIDAIAARVGEFGSRMIAAITPSDAEKARANREKAEEEAAGIEADIANAAHYIRMLEISPSHEHYMAATAAVSRINLPAISA